MNLWYKWVCNQQWLYLPMFLCLRWIRSWKRWFIALYCVLFDWYLLFMIDREVLRVHGKGEIIGSMVTSPLNLMRLVRNTRAFESIVLCLGEISTHFEFILLFAIVSYMYSDKLVLKDFYFFLFYFFGVIYMWINLSSKNCI